MATTMMDTRTVVTPAHSGGTHNEHLRRLAQILWRMVIRTLIQRGALSETSVMPKAVARVRVGEDGQPERVQFVFLPDRMGDLSYGQLRRVDLAQHITAVAGGRRVVITLRGGIAIQVAVQPGEKVEQARALIPTNVALPVDSLRMGETRVYLGESARGPVSLDLAGEHRAVLIGGTTGTGKTTALYLLIGQITRQLTGNQLRLFVVDPKGVMGVVKGLSHLAGYSDDPTTYARVLGAVVSEMYRRQKLFAEMSATVVELEQYNARAGEPLPVVLVVVDELADLVGDVEALGYLTNIARKGRSFGVSVIVATQYPTREAVKREVSINLPTRIALRVPDITASQVVLGPGNKDAARLEGRGRALLLDGAGQTEVQVYRAGPELVEVYAPSYAPVYTPAHKAEVQTEPALQVEPTPTPALTLPLPELAALCYARDTLAGRFNVSTLIKVFEGAITARTLKSLSTRYQSLGWLGTRETITAPRPLTESALAQVRHLAPGWAEIWLESVRRENGASGGQTVQASGQAVTPASAPTTPPPSAIKFAHSRIQI